jgi:triacylglycerol lipase
MAWPLREFGMDDYALALLAQATHHDAPTWAHGDAYAYGKPTDDGTIVVAFRGSHSINDWIHDFEVHPAFDPDLGSCHSGFLGNVRGVADQIMRDIAGKRTIVTGHSKGGAEAKLFAALLVVAGQPPAYLTTFGAPRVAAHDNDRLAALLAAIPGTDYRHRVDPVPGVPHKFIHPRPVLQLVEPHTALEVITDHLIVHYIAALKAALKPSG